ncbi:TonB-dependent receptor [Flammeovirga yaeyamensis]|uniref:TonB-dependent receptor n=1 Tax=Flammeovirga yaeyamensis TaxID=367791 RepID=A0AAX1N6K5_9BACT|nr:MULTISPECIES: TonB-dependent receptor [Flammeovirga]ANQ49667.1 TonB-dependent receptor [Flammeovirga sp. MY04]MBB3697474.1 TonB-linked SusC/RagA family outer membrane protein [Flammeovirga yaeyamensis]NMF36168.1 TonB-dependent receptor [Flammeovirga yaeyamensis]QWG02901.1 TonB-dependent receptor [Flammeovirga yaeyamensis]
MLKTKQRIKLHWFMPLLMFILFSTQLSAQDKKIVKGKVVDTDGVSPLPGVNVSIKGTTIGTITDFDGKFSIELNSGQNVLSVSFIGYKTQEIEVGARTQVDVTMQIDEKELEEVVVVGYGVQKKSLITGSTASVDTELLQNRSSGTLTDAMAGITPGVSLTPNSGMPGSDAKVRIRGAGSNGNSEPLYIIDGVKSGSIADLAPEDIESIEVLKDAASAAIYGSEGGNGVILVTTKSGAKGESKISYNFRYGIQSADKRNLPKTLSADQYIQFQNEMFQGNSGYTPLTSTGYNTNWLEEVVENAPIQSHTLSMQGGNDKTTYYTSLNYYEQDGIIGGDKASYDRLNARFNVKHELKPWASISTNLTYSRENRSGLTDQDEYRGIIASSLTLEPMLPIAFEPGQENANTQLGIESGFPMYKDEQGRYYSTSNQGLSEATNPFVQQILGNGGTQRDKLLGVMALEVKPFKNLSITTRPSIDWSGEREHFYDMPFWSGSDNNSNTLRVTDNNTYYHQWMWENFATYDQTFGDHTIQATVGMSAQQSFLRTLTSASGPMNVNNPLYNEHAYTGQSNNDLNAFTDENKMVSYFGRVSYDYKNRYMFTATLRNDITSTAMVPYNNISGVFPSFSAGWNISNEEFFPKDFVIDYLKLRGSWGQNGSIKSIPGRFLYKPSIVSENINIVVPGNELMFGSEPSVLSNPDLTWETSDQTNIGIDLNAFDGKVSFGIDWYRKITKDLLAVAQVPATVGNWAPNTNLGDIENTGVEIVIGYNNHDNEFKYGFNLNMATLKNKVIKVNDPAPFIAGAEIGPGWKQATVFQEGYPMWYFRGYKSEGVNSETGEPILADLDGDGEITEADKTYLGDPHPDITYGGQIFASYKGFDLNIVMQGQAGAQAVIGWYRPDRLKTNTLVHYYENRWTPDNKGASLPSPTTDSNYYQSDFLVHDANFFRIKQIQLGYSFKKSFVEKLYLSNLRLYVSMDDYFTFTNYIGMDPIAGNNDANALGIDKGVYPTPRKMMFGLNVAF